MKDSNTRAYRVVPVRGEKETVFRIMDPDGEILSPNKFLSALSGGGDRTFMLEATVTEMQYETPPFSVRLARDVQSGKVPGEIVNADGRIMEIPYFNMHGERPLMGTYIYRGDVVANLYDREGAAEDGDWLEVHVFQMRGQEESGAVAPQEEEIPDGEKKEVPSSPIAKVSDEEHGRRMKVLTEWRAANPDGTRNRFIAEMKISKKWTYRYWDCGQE